MIATYITQTNITQTQNMKEVNTGDVYIARLDEYKSQIYMTVLFCFTLCLYVATEALPASLRVAVLASTRVHTFTVQ